MRTTCSTKSYCIAVGLPHRWVTEIPGSETCHEVDFSARFIRLKEFQLHSYGLELDGVDLGALPSGTQSIDITLDPSADPVADGANNLQITGGTFDAFTSIEVGIDSQGGMDVPEPSTLAICGLGAWMLAAYGRRLQKKSRLNGPPFS